jgi:hypothetical protein
MWDKNSFAHGSPASLTSSLVQRTVPEGEAASHAWLASLPIAAAIYRVDTAARSGSRPTVNLIISRSGEPAMPDLIHATSMT